jgi:hypothetical protein
MPAGRNQLKRPSKYKDIRLGAWNVLSLYRGDALRNLVGMIQTYKIDAVEQDLRTLGIRGWKNIALDRSR